MDSAVGFTASTASIPWRALYLQALFETDRSQICIRIAQAELALLRREHELYNDPSPRSERDAVINALHALHALRSCLVQTAFAA